MAKKRFIPDVIKEAPAENVPEPQIEPMPETSDRIESFECDGVRDGHRVRLKVIRNLDTGERTYEVV